MGVNRLKGKSRAGDAFGKLLPAGLRDDGMDTRLHAAGTRREAALVGNPLGVELAARQVLQSRFGVGSNVAPQRFQGPPGTAQISAAIVARSNARYES